MIPLSVAEEFGHGCMFIYTSNVATALRSTPVGFRVTDQHTNASWQCFVWKARPQLSCAVMMNVDRNRVSDETKRIKMNIFLACPSCTSIGIGNVSG